MKFSLFHALPFIALVVASCSLLLAQEAEKNAVVTVEVTDQSGAPVPNAKTKFVALESADARTLATAATGRALLELKPGNYDLVVTMPAFRTLKSRIKVSAGESEKFDIVLHIASCPPGCVQVSTAASQLGTVQSQSETKDIHITNVKLFTWLGGGDKRKYEELNEFREAKDLHIPGSNFDLVCEVTGEPELSSGDFFLWTSVDFVVAPVTQEYESMDTAQLGSSVAWGQVTEIHDLRAEPIYFLRPGETRHVTVKDFDLERVLAAFPVGNAGNLWPWVLRINIHIQDREGTQITSASRVVRIWPHPNRKAN
jgi:Carboxypeptidase regulatory-like domain